MQQIGLVRLTVDSGVECDLYGIALKSGSLHTFTLFVLNPSWESMRDYYLLLDGQQAGPYTPHQLNEYLTEGRLTPEIPAWYEGLPDWVRLGTILGSDLAQPPLPVTAVPSALVALPAEGSLPNATLIQTARVVAPTGATSIEAKQETHSSGMSEENKKLVAAGIIAVTGLIIICTFDTVVGVLVLIAAGGVAMVTGKNVGK